jgi:hypothetical protein
MCFRRRTTLVLVHKNIVFLKRVATRLSLYFPLFPSLRILIKSKWPVAPSSYLRDC